MERVEVCPVSESDDNAGRIVTDSCDVTEPNDSEATDGCTDFVNRDVAADIVRLVAVDLSVSFR